MSQGYFGAKLYINVGFTMMTLSKGLIEFDLPDSYSLRQLHAAQRQLKLDAEIVSNILQAAKVKHCLAFGTLLGAIRHQGFIPWDDDFDFFIFDEYYDLAMNVLQKYLPRHLVIHSEKNDENYFHCWSRVKNTNTIVEYGDAYHPDNQKLKFKCLGIDLYRLNEMRVDQVETYLQIEAEKFWNRKYATSMISRDEYLNVPKLIRQHVEAKLSNMALNQFEKSEMVRYFCLVMNDPIKSDLFDDMHAVKFENTSFLAPMKSHEVLRSLYGRYDVLPDWKRRNTNLTSFDYVK